MSTETYYALIPVGEKFTDLTGHKLIKLSGSYAIDATLKLSASDLAHVTKTPMLPDSIVEYDYLTAAGLTYEVNL